MSLRTQLKVAKYGLFYFECDKTVSIIPLKKISKVLKGDNTSSGSIVEVYYGELLLTGKIIAVHDVLKALEEKQLEFITNPENKHLFPDDNDHEDDQIYTAPKEKKRKPACVAKNAVKKAPLKQPKERTKPRKKEKEQATVVARFKPSSGSGATGVERLLPTSPNSSSKTPSVSSPPHAPSPTPNSLRSSPLVPLSPYFLRSSPLSVASSPRPGTGSTFMPRDLLKNYTSTDDLLSTLKRVEEKIDNLAANQANNTDSRYCANCTIRLPFSAQSNYHSESASSNYSFSSVAGHSSICNPLPVKSESPPSSFTLSNESLMRLKRLAHSSVNFAVRLVREMFDTSEIIGRNVAGVRGKLPVDPARIKKVEELVREFYPAPPGDAELMWRECRKGIDSFLRKLKS